MPKKLEKPAKTRKKRGPKEERCVITGDRPRPYGAS